MLRLMQKMTRDLWKYKIQFCSVFLMSLLGIMIYTGIEGVWLGMDNQSKMFFKETNLADLWVYGSSFTDDDLSKIKNIDNVREAESTMIADVESESKIKLKNNQNSQIRMIISDDNSISKLEIIKGEKFNKDSEGCWIDYSYAKEQKIDVGDNIKLSYSDVTHKYKVEGLIMSPEYVSYTGSATAMTPDHKKYGYCLMSEKGGKGFLGKVDYNQIRVKLDKASDVKKVKEDIEYELGSKFTSCYDKSEYPGVAIFINQIKQLRILSFMFSILFILLSLLAMQTTMKRLVDNQKMQIGTMKALGFSNIQILIHYSLYGFTISLLGSFIGFLLAPSFITPILLNIQKNFYTMPRWSGEISIISYIIIAIIVLACTITTIVACREGIQGMPAETMRNSTSVKNKNSYDKDDSKIWSRISFEWKWSVRDILRNKGRAVIAIIGVAGCMMLLIASFGMYDSLKKANTSLFGEQYDYYAKVAFSNNATDKDKDEVYKLVNPDAQKIEDVTAEVKTDKTQKTSSLSIIDDGYYIHLKDSNGKVINLSSENVVVSNRLAEQLNIKKDDNLKIRLTDDDRYTVIKVDSIIPITAPQGIFISKKAWENLNYSFKPNFILVGKEKAVDRVEKKSGVKEVVTLKDQLEDMDNVLDSAVVIVVLLIFAAVFLSIIILFNLGVLSFTERSREYATLKVLGFKQKEIKNLIFKDSMITTIIGWIVGIPLGFVFLKLYVISISTDTFEYVPYIKIQSLLIATLITFGCALFIIIILSRKVRKIDMVQALKSVE
ncbi:ABC transporter permease [Clostridium sp. C8-1-8]|uniref:ABC transporter permease n=1 Tax=Clostridium sp. C8-1-8 TaxID=2698831 RepID=UPI00137106E2|nr:ABC transporter permease [Clostridium sp. C8-1-8]